jgi:DNA-binding transcriptional ArsR family regulator
VGREAPSDRRLATAAPVFTALGDRTRLHLVSRLCQEGALSISDLTEGTALTRQAVTKHLRVLADAGLATSARRGREHHWRIEATRLAEVRRLLAQISDQWDRALTRLIATVEAEDDPGRRRGC